MWHDRKKTMKSIPYLRHLKGDSVLGPKLFQLSHDTVRDAWDALSVQAVHHAAHQINLCERNGLEETEQDERKQGIHIHRKTKKSRIPQTHIAFIAQPVLCLPMQAFTC
jgi:hypothetical protein